MLHPPSLRPWYRRPVTAAIAFELSLVAVAALLGALFATRPLMSASLSPWALSAGLAAAVPMAAGLPVLLRTTHPEVLRIRRILDATLPRLFGDAGTLALALTALAAGIGEEALFRGLLQGALTGPLGTWGALLVASLVFGLAHAVTGLYALIATVFGLYLGGLWVATGDLTVPIVAHAAYDFVAFMTFIERPAAPITSDSEDSRNSNAEPPSPI